MIARHAINMAQLGDRIVMYTDGGCRSPKPQDPMTAGVTYKCGRGRGRQTRVSPWIDRSYGILGIRTANGAETVALAEALEVLASELRSYVDLEKQRSPTQQPRLQAMIFTDSRHCLGLLQKMILTLRRGEHFTGLDKTEDYLQTKVKTLAESISSTGLKLLLEFHWIKGHSKIPGNVRADRLAYDAFPIAEIYFTDHEFTGDDTVEIADMAWMKNTLTSRRQEFKTSDSGSSSEYASSTTGIPNSTGVGERPSGFARSTPNSDPQAQTTEVGDQASILSAVLKQIEALRLEVGDQNDKGYQQDAETVANSLEAHVQTSKAESVTTESTMTELESTTERQRKRDVIAASVRRAGKRIHDLGRKSKSN
ncbi:hypothetical protein PG993_008514 [Apiospora rasikravindrae]|uniref:RNase H type-1 domain-containing protein n=1 Tax=Apiospora rasikravindrae TaxID=990691 RepID=A0ABR1T0K2_9PEZI